MLRLHKEHSEFLKINMIFDVWKSAYCVLEFILHIDIREGRSALNIKFSKFLQPLWLKSIRKRTTI